MICADGLAAPDGRQIVSGDAGSLWGGEQAAAPRSGALNRGDTVMKQRAGGNGE
jgi:hypothetical protein